MDDGSAKREIGWARLALRGTGSDSIYREEELASVVDTIARLPLSALEDVSMRFIERGRAGGEDMIPVDRLEWVENTFYEEVRDAVYWKEFWAHMTDSGTSEDAEDMVNAFDDQLYFSKEEMFRIGHRGIARALTQKKFDRLARKRYLKRR